MKANLKILYNLNIREKLIIATTILLIVGYLIYSLIIPPTLFHCKIAKRQLSVQRCLIESKEKKTKNLLQLERSFEDLQRKMDAQKRTFFTEEEAVDFLKNLDRVAMETKNDLKKIRPQTTKIISDSNLGKEYPLCYKKDIVEVIAQGGYNNILNLFNRLADYEKLLGVTQLDLKHSREDPSRLEAKFILNIYILGRE